MVTQAESMPVFPTTGYIKPDGMTNAIMGNSWADLFSGIDPIFCAFFGTAFGLGFSVLGAAWGIFLTGSSLLGAAIKVPRIRSKNLISVIFCEALAIYGVIIAIISATKLDPKSTWQSWLDEVTVGGKTSTIATRYGSGGEWDPQIMYA